MRRAPYNEHRSVIGLQITASPNKMPAAPRWLGGPLRVESGSQSVTAGRSAYRA
jgi:hypothetical protein